MYAIIAVGLRQAYTNYRHLPSHEVPLRVLFIIASIIATIYTNYWDLCVDWGLLNSQSKNRWLRDKLILRNKKIYFAAIVSEPTAAKFLSVAVFGMNMVFKSFQ